jgi:hypothetical protein
MAIAKCDSSLLVGQIRAVIVGRCEAVIARKGHGQAAGALPSAKTTGNGRVLGVSGFVERFYGTGHRNLLADGSMVRQQGDMICKRAGLAGVTS